MRVDVYRSFHRILRDRLYRLGISFCRADFSGGDVSVLATELAATRSLLEEHARAEDRHIHPILAIHAPELLEALEHEHRGIEVHLEVVGTLLAQHSDRSLSERRALGPLITRELHGFLVGYMQHLLNEESEANEVLWSQRTDPQLLELARQIGSASRGLCAWRDEVSRAETDDVLAAAR